MGNFIVQLTTQVLDLSHWKHINFMKRQGMQANGGMCDLYENLDAITIQLLSPPDSAHAASDFKEVLSQYDQSVSLTQCQVPKHFMKTLLN